MHYIARFSYSDGESCSIECDCGWSAIASNPIPLFNDWHEHLCNSIEDEEYKEENNAG
jgi:hypothetical protein